MRAARIMKINLTIIFVRIIEKEGRERRFYVDSTQFQYEEGILEDTGFEFNSYRHVKDRSDPDTNLVSAHPIPADVRPNRHKHI